MLLCRDPTASFLSVLLALLCPSFACTFSSSAAFHPGPLQISSIKFTKSIQIFSAGRLRTLKSGTTTSAQRFPSTVACRLTAPPKGSPSQDSMDTGLSRMHETFPTSSEVELKRFLNKQKWDVGKASAMYAKYLEWQEASLPDMEEETRNVPEWLWYHGQAKDGTRILFVQGALHDPTRANADQFTLHTAEKMLELSDESDSKITVLVDVRAQQGAANAPAMKLLPYLRQVAPLMNNFFPGRLKRMVVYPVPRAASALWGVVRGFLSSSTAAKVLLLPGSDRAGSPVPAELFEHVEFEELRADVQVTHRLQDA